MKYTIGDKVRIRRDLIVGKSYGQALFIDDMVGVMGKVVTITGDYYGQHGYEYHDIKGNGYSWTEEMFAKRVNQNKSLICYL